MRIKHIPSDLSPEDQRTYRRWTRGLFITYSVAIIVAIGIIYLTKPATDPGATAQMAHVKPASSPAVSSSATPVARR